MGLKINKEKINLENQLKDLEQNINQNEIFLTSHSSLDIESKSHNLQDTTNRKYKSKILLNIVVKT